MAVNIEQEMIWQGRLHLGDEPGIYGDAAYSGICAELPVTISRADPTTERFWLILDTANLKTFSGYPGHQIIVMIYEVDPTHPFHSTEREVANGRFTSDDLDHKEMEIKVGKTNGSFRLSVRLRCDTNVNPGLYNDFIWQKLSIKAQNFAFFASFGFSV